MYLAVLLLSLTLLFPDSSHGSSSIRNGEVSLHPAQYSQDLSAEEKNTISVFEQATRSVVYITNTSIRRDPWSLNLFEVPQGSGTGFVWNRRGHIVTNFHVVYNADTISITMADRKEYQAKVVGVDPDHDLAVLLIDVSSKEVVPVRLGNSQGLLVGQQVMAIGNPFGLDHTLTTGVVSAIGRTIKSMTNRTIEGVIQTDAAINPGNSGGPLLDRVGRVIGINTQIVSPSGAFAGIGFAVPVNTIKRVVPDLIRYGKLRKPGLGVRLVADAIVKRWGLTGVVIRVVEPGSAAERAGLRGVRESRSGKIKLGDVIIGLAGTPVQDMDEFLTVLDKFKIGETVTVDFLRNGHQQQSRVILQEIE